MSKDVLTFPLKETYGIVHECLVYSRPQDEKPISGMGGPETHYLAFRAPEGGVMTSLYTLHDPAGLLLNPLKDIDAELQRLQQDLPEPLKTRLADYIKATAEATTDAHGLRGRYRLPQRFYLLVFDRALSHSPRPRRNNAGHVYYSLDYLMHNTVLSKKP